LLDWVPFRLFCRLTFVTVCFAASLLELDFTDSLDLD
jgi:hypothetical protein